MELSGFNIKKNFFYFLIFGQTKALKKFSIFQEKEILKTFQSNFPSLTIKRTHSEEFFLYVQKWNFLAHPPPLPRPPQKKS